MTSTPSIPADLPDPLVPAEVDLRGNDWMPLYGERLFTSETWIEGSYEARVAALRLWWQAFAKEKPAASLPDSDRLLAVYAGYGEVVRAWKKIKAEAMRGFVLCSDGRWYHRVIAELVIDAWHRRQDQSEANAARTERQKRWRERLRKLTTALREVGITPPQGASLETLERMARDASVDVYTPSREIGLTGQEKTGQEKTGKDKEEVYGADAPPPAEAQPADPSSAGGSGAASNANGQPQLPMDDRANLPLRLDRSTEAQAVKLWNETAERLNAELGRTEWPLVQKLTSARRKAIRARLKDGGGIDGWRTALGKASRDPWLRGESQRSPAYENWRFELDTLVREKFFTKLMERPDDGTPSRRHEGESGSLGDALAGYLATDSR